MITLTLNEGETTDYLGYLNVKGDVALSVRGRYINASAPVLERH